MGLDAFRNDDRVCCGGIVEETMSGCCFGIARTEAL